ncbi:MAG TPA: RIP metalloprotease RseP [Planctomycetota bacterium]|nr:RIP metalloprotease RseP [Planctomycetota bacterium]
MMDLAELGRYAQVALGIGLVIFVHELGHFIAARLCKVRVEVFSLGFGPRLFGWKRGDTMYQLALVPLGGFVKMAGEETPAGDTPAPDELPAKSVGQRFFIYSGGVLMNVIFALVVFPPLLFIGVPMPEPVIGGTVPGGGAWKAGIEPGTRVLSVNGHRVVSFDELQSEIALAAGEELRLDVRVPGATADSVIVVSPEYDKDFGFRMIGVEGAADPAGTITVTPDSPAEAAGLRTGDRVVGVQGERTHLAERMLRAQQKGEPLVLDLERDGETIQSIQPKIVESKKKDLALGLQSTLSHVKALRPGAAVSKLGLQQDDRLRLVDGRAILRDGDFEDALRASLGRPFELLVQRGGDEMHLPVEALDLQQVEQAVRDVALLPDAEDTRVALQPWGPAAKAGLQDGDRLVRINEVPLARWEDIKSALKSQARAGEALAVDVQRRTSDGGTEYVSLDVVPGRLTQCVYGVSPNGAMYTFHAETFGEAVQIGAHFSWKFLIDSWNTLRGIFVGTVSENSLGGIILISQVSYAFASMGVAKLLFFLCMLSLNLAFLNVLPIPVLDGGHLFFLLVEKIKGSPVNERVLGYSQMVGLVLILGLVVFVTFNDLRRFLG